MTTQVAQDRTARLAGLLSAAELDVLLVTGLVNVRYLTGYTGSNGLVLVGPELRRFVTDFRYAEQAAAEVDPSFDRVQAPVELLEGLADALPDGALRVGFEAAHTSVSQHAFLCEQLPDGVELAPTADMVESLRAVKDAAEIAAVRAATALADASFQRLLEDGLVGRSEREAAIALEHDMVLQGARVPSFEAIVAAGPHGALPHARPRDVEIRRGDLVVIDWGAQLDGYCSDCTRTVAAGEPGAEAREIYELVLEAQHAGVDAVRADRPTAGVDAVARDIIGAAGHGDNFGHGLGHGVGLEVHEAPWLRRRSDEVLQAGNVVTVEPGVYLAGRFGVRIEDLVAVIEDGAEILTSVPKQLIVSD
ncbi:MAG: M24 family metallopeptidase [Solirubrobacteraceae bacterium]